MVRVGPDGTVLEGINGMAVDWSSIDPTIRVLEGAVPDGTDPFEVVVNEAFVELHDLGVGDRRRRADVRGRPGRGGGDRRLPAHRTALHVPDRGRRQDADRHRRRRSPLDRRVGERLGERDGRLVRFLRGPSRRVPRLRGGLRRPARRTGPATNSSRRSNERARRRGEPLVFGTAPLPGPPDPARITGRTGDQCAAPARRRDRDRRDRDDRARCCGRSADPTSTTSRRCGRSATRPISSG